MNRLSLSLDKEDLNLLSLVNISVNTEQTEEDNGRKNEEGILNGGKIRQPTSNGLRLTEYNQSQPQILKMEAPGTPE